MSNTWYINLKEEIDRKTFNELTKSLDIGFSPAVIGGNTYYDVNNGMEIDFGGTEQTVKNNTSATQITVRSISGITDACQKMMETTLKLGEKLPFKDISGEWFDDVAEIEEGTEEPKQILYTPDVFKLIE